MSRLGLFVPAGIVLALCSTPPVCLGVSPANLTGSVLGSVKDSTGVPQMGATVMLYNQQEKLVQKGITNLRGDFLFDALPTGVYSLRVAMATFVPALKRNIVVQPGMQSVLAINLASLLSSIEVVYSGPRRGPLMSDEWKWVLRSSMSTRPVLRSLPDLPGTVAEQNAAMFSETTGMLRVSSPESTPFHSDGNQPDLGTAFALATSLFGNNRLQVAGNIGYAIETAAPTTGMRATFSRLQSDAQGPSVKLTMQQASMPVRAGLVAGGRGSENIPALRRLSVTTIDRMQLGDDIEFVYGGSLDSVTFFDRLNYLSPFARVTWQAGESGRLAFGFSSGAPPIEIYDMGPGAELQQDLMALSLLPRVSVRNGHAEVQRTQNFELGYQLREGKRTWSVGAFREVVRNGALTISGADDVIDSMELMPELASRSSVFNIGGYKRYGYMAAMTQELSDTYTVTLAWGSGGALRADGRMLETGDPGEIRDRIDQRQQHWASARVAGTAPAAGTKFSASYQWADRRSLTPAHVYFTQSTTTESGVNLRIRQPLPGFPGIPGRIEASAELRNLLAQGYLPIVTAGGKRLILAHSPRAVRGGVSFIF